MHLFIIKNEDIPHVSVWKSKMYCEVGEKARDKIVL